ncbi:amidohydrolase family protein [Pseudothauera nasutitermitis]|uniref:Amidohydrolase family protein n=1 Tax=Pseudothauera nasutitermitis TaxID=2565930 RepID=A0A4S4AV99_9RHOO|nr:amidohydrolase family protein [Pseudothauera nasutitermitis]THF63754.1 amidohydrolase family protein [Pseudothauera nasutitermitis]
MKKHAARLLAAIASGILFTAAHAAEEILIRNVHVFDGTGTARSRSTLDVLVADGTIRQIAATPIEVPAGATVIDGQGRTLMPGLIDAHWHSALVAPSQVDALTADTHYIALLAGKVADATLMRGFTTVRDMGGPTFGLRRAIESGVIAGPRIFPSGAMISQTGGHGDFRLPYEIPRANNAPLSHSERVGAAAIADGADEVLRRAREQLMLGATQLKLMAGGGVSSVYDPLDVTQYTVEELRAAVSAAENWGTYATVHAYTPRAIKAAIEAGVKSIEHGQLVDEETVKLMASKGIWWSLQPFLDDESANPRSGASRVKQLMVAAGTDRAYELAKKHGVQVAFGTDILFSGSLGGAQSGRLTTLTRWYTPGEVLKMATGDNARLIALAGERYPYPAPLGVVKEGALADLLLVDGDPTADLSLLDEPERTLVLIVKNGRIHKNLLGGVE